MNFQTYLRLIKKWSAVSFVFEIIIRAKPCRAIWRMHHSLPVHLRLPLLSRSFIFGRHISLYSSTDTTTSLSGFVVCRKTKGKNSWSVVIWYTVGILWQVSLLDKYQMAKQCNFVSEAVMMRNRFNLHYLIILRNNFKFNKSVLNVK